jgi:5-methylcytosine-specific restriction endonuclease McrA
MVWRAENRESYLAYQSEYNKQRRGATPEQRAAKAVYDKAYQAANNKAISSRQKAHRADHKEDIAAYSRAYYAANRTALLASNRAYVIANSEAVAKYNREYTAAHLAEANARWHKRRARIAAAPINDLTVAQWLEIKAAFGGCCAYCGMPCDALTQDHIVPLVKGGSHTASNIVPACRSCNARKSAMPVEDFMARLEAEGTIAIHELS